MTQRVKAVETLDQMRRTGGEALAEVERPWSPPIAMPNADARPRDGTATHCAHHRPVPLYLLGDTATLESGALQDVAPTLLNLMGVEQPDAMTGRSLL